MSSDLFKKPWFSGPLLHAFYKIMQGDESGLDATEQRLIADTCWHVLDSEQRQALPYGEMLRFFAYAYLNRLRSSAQIHQDLWALHMSGEKRGGFFVEFGACEGTFLSNTLLLERDYGWTGILAEPNPQYHAALHANRSCKISELCVAARSGEMAAFDCATRPELSRLRDVVPDDVHERQSNRVPRETIEVRTISLSDLLEQHGAPNDIDYLSIDTEGSELQILEGFDFARWRCRLITVEHAGEEAKREGIFRLLTSHGYSRWFPDYSRWDDWYVRQGT